MPFAWLKNNLILILILIFSILLFTYKLGSIPPSLYADEASEGYSAYSIWLTGKDEYGKTFPLLFRLFGAYTPPLYIYLSAPIVGLFGLTVFNIRLLSAISGVISVLIFYLILHKYLSNKLIIYFSTIVYSILPWTVFNSRLGYEVMLAATLFNIGIYFLLSKEHDYLGFLFLSLSTYTAHTQKFLVPIFLFFFLIYYKKINLKNIGFLLLTQLPNLYLTTTAAFWSKSSGLSHYSLIQIISNFINQFVNYLSPYTLFFQPQDIDQQHLIPQIGLFFWWMVIPLVIGLKTAPKFLIFWLIISIVPASLSGDFISVQRALPLLFPLMIIISLGLRSFKPTLLVILSIYSFLLLYRSYFVLFPYEMTKAWNYGYSQLSQFIQQNPDKKFLIDNTRNNGSYSLILFNLKYSPRLYHLEISNYFRDNYYQVPPTSSSYSFNNLDFEPLLWPNVNCRYDFVVGDDLSISSEQAKDHQLTLIQTISTPSNQIALKIFSIPKDGKICR